MSTPLILYVPGLLPKPEAGVHKEALRRCLLAGLRQHDAGVAAELVLEDEAPARTVEVGLGHTAEDQREQEQGSHGHSAVR